MFMSGAAITFVVLAAALILFVWNRLPVELVAIGAALALYLTGVLSLSQSLAGFSDPAVVFIATLFVVSEGLDGTGVTMWAGHALIARATGSRRRLLVLAMLPVALLTALISVNGAVAALLPIGVLMGVRRGPPSQLLLPMVFAAHAGSLLTLTGTPVNVLVSEMAAETTGRGFGFFEFSLVGVFLLAGTVAIALWLGERLLPNRTARVIPPDLSDQARTLMTQYALQDTPFRLRVKRRSRYVGHAPAAFDLSEYPGLTIVGAQTNQHQSANPSRPLAAGDVVVVRGKAKVVARFAADGNLEIGPGLPGGSAEALFTHETGIAELMVPPRGEMIGARVFPGMVTSSGDFVIVAIQRSGVDMNHEVTLAAGDTLLVRGPWEALDERTARPDVLVVDEPDLVRRRAAPMGRGATIAMLVLGAMIAVIATGLLPEATAGILAVCVLIASRTITVDQAYRAISWTTVILVAGMMPLATAMRTTGAAESMAGWIVSAAGSGGPYVLLIALFLLTAGLGQMLSNVAAALIVSPIAISAAHSMSISPRPLLMTVAVAAAASFLTPVATPVNLMVKEPGGYRFGDYWKLGLPLLLLFFIVSVAFIPLFWRF
jgi:di/tricarboxylate transporter